MSFHAVHKRYACDRCRDLKLRCPRVDSSGDEPCTRCQRAGALCVTGGSRPVGRPRTNTASGFTTLGRGHPRRQQSDSMAASSSLTSTASTTRPSRPTMTPGGEATAPVLSWTAKPSSLAMNDYSSMCLESLLQLPTPDNTSPSGSNPTEAPLDAIEQFFGLLPPDVELGGVAASPQLGATMEDGDGYFGAEVDGDQHRNAMYSTIGLLPDDTNTPRQTQQVVATGEAITSDAASLGVHDALISLSRLNVSVSQQLAKFDSYPWHDPPLMQPLCSSRINAATDNPVAEALQSTTRLVAILKSLSRSKCDQSSGTWPLLDLGVSMADSRHGGNARGGVTSLPGAAEPPHLSTATYLLLLSSYVQLVHLFNTMFRRMAEVLGDMTEEDMSEFHPQPEFGVAGLPALPSRLYLKILVQIIDHQLESVDGLMGLSGACCISGRAPRKGIFTGQDVAGLLQTIMGQENEGDRPESTVPDGSLIASLRESMTTVQELLRG